MAAAVVLCLLLAAAPVGAVDRSKFRTCDQASFCRRFRSEDRPVQYAVGKGTLQRDCATVTGELAGGPVPLRLEAQLLATGTTRVRMIEAKPLHRPRSQPKDILLEKGLTLADAGSVAELSAGGAALPADLKAAVGAGAAVTYAFGKGGSSVLLLTLEPAFGVALYVGGEPDRDVHGRPATCARTGSARAA